MADASDLTPVEWLGRLGPRLRDRSERILYWERYYRGDHDLPSGPQQHRDAYRRFQKLARTNLCGLCVESRVHRMKVIGYRDGSTAGGSDDAVWQLWQRAKLDSRQFTVYRKAFAQSEAYVIAAPSPTDPRVPRVSIEGPLNVIVERDPAEPALRLAALRMWHDPFAKRWMATLWLPGWRYSFQSVGEFADRHHGRLGYGPENWEQRSAPARSSQVIPVVPFANGDEGDEPRAVFAGGLDVQNRLNLTLLNRLTAERYAAFRQRYLLNYVPEEDPETGLPVPPFNPGADQTITVPPPEPGDPATQIGDLAQTDTSNMLQACTADIRSFAATTLTPVYYLPGGDLVNISGDAIMALDAGHVQSIEERMSAWSEQWEEVLALCADIAGLDRDLSASEVVWQQPEHVQPGVVADYATKLVAAGYPLPLVAEKIGESPQLIAKLRAELDAQAAQRAASGQPSSPTAANAAPTTPATGPAAPPRGAAPGASPSPA